MTISVEIKTTVDVEVTGGEIRTVKFGNADVTNELTGYEEEQIKAAIKE